MKPGRRRRAMVIVGTWIVVTLAATAGLRLINSTSIDLDSRLSGHGMPTIATVTGLAPNDHNQVEYSFAVDGTTYTSDWFGHGREGSAGELRIGESIHIYYDSTDPDYSCYCELRDLHESSELWRNLLAGCLASVGLSAFLLSIGSRVRSAIWREPSQLHRPPEE